MSEIKRREWDENEERYVECEDGTVVLYADHVAEIEQWENRAFWAEDALSRKEYYDAMRVREIDMSQIPDSQKSFVSSLLNQRDDFWKKWKDAEAKLARYEDWLGTDAEKLGEEK